MARWCATQQVGATFVSLLCKVPHPPVTPGLLLFIGPLHSPLKWTSTMTIPSLVQDHAFHVGHFQHLRQRLALPLALLLFLAVVPPLSLSPVPSPTSPPLSSVGMQMSSQSRHYQCHSLSNWKVCNSQPGQSSVLVIHQWTLSPRQYLDSQLRLVTGLGSGNVTLSDVS